MEDLINSEHMKVFRTPSGDSAYDTASLPQTASNPHGQTDQEVVPAGFADWDNVDVFAESPAKRWTSVDAAFEGAQILDSAADACAGATPAPLASPLCRQSQPDTGCDSGCKITDVATFAPLPMSAGIDERRQDITDPEDNEIAATDWLEVANAMSDLVHAS